MTNDRFLQAFKKSSVYVLNPQDPNPLNRRIGFVNGNSVDILNVQDDPEHLDLIVISFPTEPSLTVGSGCGSLYINANASMNAVKIDDNTFEVVAEFDGCEPLFQGATGTVRITLLQLD